MAKILLSNIFSGKTHQAKVLAQKVVLYALILNLSYVIICYFILKISKFRPLLLRSRLIRVRYLCSV